ncbi:hypothetical protein J5X84_45080 [Streptosporangiaceae bacterium NEAU-GS5]|nr:hypothetical protein [Streptosporangiaceae bacterium NEAU-GS5]
MDEVQRQITAGLRALRLSMDGQVAQGLTTAEHEAALMERAYRHGAQILALAEFAAGTRPDETARQTPDS